MTLIEVADIVNPPPPLALTNYPAVIGALLVVGLSIVLLFVSGKFDPTGGVLTISLLITIGMIAAVAYCLIFTIPADDITPGIIGGLTAGFGAVVAHWLGQRKEPPNNGK